MAVSFLKIPPVFLSGHFVETSILKIDLLIGNCCAIISKQTKRKPFRPPPKVMGAMGEYLGVGTASQILVVPIFLLGGSKKGNDTETKKFACHVSEMPRPKRVFDCSLQWYYQHQNNL